MPISVRKTSRFFPLRFAFAASRTFSRVSQHATQGSVFTLANDKSSFLGLKSVFFCFVSCAESQLTRTGGSPCVKVEQSVTPRETTYHPRGVA